MDKSPLSFTSFLCPMCHTEIEATTDLSGQSAECPACGAKLTVPSAADDKILCHGVDDLDKSHTQALKNRTIRIELEDL